MNGAGLKEEGHHVPGESSRDLHPIFDTKTWDTAKLTQIIRYQACTETDRVCRD